MNKRELLHLVLGLLVIFLVPFSVSFVAGRAGGDWHQLDFYQDHHHRGRAEFTLGFDMDISGNPEAAGPMLGPVNLCIEAEPGDTVTFDIFLELPAGFSLLGFDYTIAFPAGPLTITQQIHDDPAVNLIAMAPGSDIVDLSEPVPDGDGLHVVAVSDINPLAAEFGPIEGVLGRYSLAIAPDANPVVYELTMPLANVTLMPPLVMLQSVFSGRVAVSPATCADKLEPPGFPLVTPLPPEAPAIGEPFPPPDASVSILPGIWTPGSPAVSAFHIVDMCKLGGEPGTLTATDPVAEFFGLSSGPALKLDRLWFRTCLNSAEPLPPSPGCPCQLYVQFGANPMELPEGSILQVAAWMPDDQPLKLFSQTSAFWYLNDPPRSYAFNVILVDAAGEVADVLDPLVKIRGESGFTRPVWRVIAPPGDTVAETLPSIAAEEFENLGVDLSEDVPSFSPTEQVVCSVEFYLGLPAGLDLDLATGALSGQAAAPEGVYCALFDVIDEDGAKVAEMTTIISVTDLYALYLPVIRQE